MGLFKTKIQIKGERGVIATIDAMNGRLVKEIEKIVQETAEKISADAAGALTESAGVDTGKYKKSIKPKYENDKTTARIAPWSKGRPHPLGHLLEFGTDAHEVGTGQHPGTDPIPHLFPAFEANRPEFERKVKEAVRGLA